MKVSEKSEGLKKAITRAENLVKCFIASFYATEDLIARTNQMLVGDVYTRCNSTLLRVKNLDLLEQSVQVVTICII